MPIRVLLLALLLALPALHAPQAAPAQQPPLVPLAFIEGNQERRLEEAFSSHYGRLLLNELIASARKGMDANCAKTKGVAAADLDDRIRALVVRNGVKLIQAHMSAVDLPALITNMGAVDMNEVTRLRFLPDIRAFMEFSATAQQAALVKTVLEMIERYALLLKIQLGRFHPYSTGSTPLILADPTEAALEKIEYLVASQNSNALNRYIELMEAMQDALNRSVDKERLMTMRIIDMMPGLEDDLAGICLLRAP